MVEFHHIPVMLEEVLDTLEPAEGKTYLDGTLGGGGHTGELLRRGATVYGVDRDADALAAATERLREYSAFHAIRGNFHDMKRLAEENAVPPLDGVLLDLGVSSFQLDTAERGFSYHADAPLDMRMSQSGPTAADLVNTLSREELTRILREYGEEPFAWAIAGKIEAAREKAPIQTTLELAQIVASAVPPAIRRRDKNPARRSFQALRIAVNGELDALNEGLDGIFDCLAPGGRFAIITFHSLEDRVVKNRFRQWATACTCPPEFPVCVCGGKAKAKLITRKPIEANAQELEENRRSRSAKLRVVEKL